MRFERRAFLQNSLLWTAAAAIDVSSSAETAQTSLGSELIARMSWMNPPVSWHRSGDKIRVHTGAKTDFWREPPVDFRDTGHFFNLSVRGEFAFQASMIGQYHAQYDQAGLLLRQNFEGGKSVFELNQGKHHDHIVCMQCGHVEEFCDSAIEARQKKIAAERGFEIHEHSLSIYADCVKPKCPHRR